jgi:DNA recombination protein RmuC
VTPDTYSLIAAGLALATLVVSTLTLLRVRSTSDAGDRLERCLRDEAARAREEAASAARALREEVAGQVRAFQEANDKRHHELRILLETKLAEFRSDQGTNAKALREEVLGAIKALGEGVAGTLRQGLSANTGAIEGLGAKVEQRLDALRGENTAKLEQMRQTVDEKLQGTLEKRLGESFKLVSDRLEQVHKGLGEMQTLASGVGDLKRVLTNVKTRGTWGEVQLGALLEQVLTAEQFQREANCRQGSSERVDFAIRLPGRGEGDAEVLLPIDSKFPTEDYDRLVLAAERADADAVELAARQLEARVKQFARDIRDKYVNPPRTTDFAILYLPTEGLYAEVLRRPGLAEQIQRDYKVTVAGPTTLAAMLNALQMGFKTLAIQKRSSEVWDVLKAVKTEFNRYGAVLDTVKKRLDAASSSIEEVAKRKRIIDRRLSKMELLPETQADTLLGLTAVLDDIGEVEEEGAEA